MSGAGSKIRRIIKWQLENEKRRGKLDDQKTLKYLWHFKKLRIAEETERDSGK